MTRQCKSFKRQCRIKNNACGHHLGHSHSRSKYTPCPLINEDKTLWLCFQEIVNSSQPKISNWPKVSDLNCISHTHITGSQILLQGRLTSLPVSLSLFGVMRVLATLPKCRARWPSGLRRQTKVHLSGCGLSGPKGRGFESHSRHFLSGGPSRTYFAFHLVCLSFRFELLLLFKSILCPALDSLEPLTVSFCRPTISRVGVSWKSSRKTVLPETHGLTGKIGCNATVPSDGPSTGEWAGLAYFLSSFPFYVFRYTITAENDEQKALLSSGPK